MLQDLPEHTKLTCITQHPGFTLSACRHGACDWHHQIGSEEKWAVLLHIAVRMRFGNCGVYGPFGPCLTIGFLKPVNSHPRETSLWNSWLLDIVGQNNIATTENNTCLRYGVSSDPSHNMRSSQSAYYAMNYTRPIPFRQVLLLSKGFLNLDFPPLWKLIENFGFNQKQKFCDILIRIVQKFV